MGGCRCVFRDCKVSTSRNPGMHFFHFPKQGPQLENWIRFSGLTNYSNLLESQRRNKVICGRHFKTICFMNYKQDRLIPTAVPTVTRINIDWALDYEENSENPKLIKVEPPNTPHLVAPRGFKDPQCFNGEDLRFADSILELYGNTDCEGVVEENASKRVKVKETKENNESPIMETTENKSGFRIGELNDNICETLSAPLNIDCIFSDKLADDRIENTEDSSEEYVNCLVEQPQLEDLEEILTIKNKELSNMTTELANRDAKLFQVRKQMKLLWQRKESECKASQRLKLQNNNLNTKYNELLVAHKELKAHVEACNAKQETISSTKDEISESREESKQLHSQHQLSKKQLFNGIKRYLSPTMIALLRMQLSSCGIERDWKPDEKRVATDLLSLGENVYKYFTDEWLIRLPSLRLATDWRNQSLQDDDDEEDL